MTFLSSCTDVIASWPLSRVPLLDERALCAILQSMTQAMVGKRQPLGLAAELPERFAQRTWQELGCDTALVQEITHAFYAMFPEDTTGKAFSFSVPSVQSIVGQAVETLYALWASTPRHIAFYTSGSTGTPKACLHKEDHIRQEISSIAPYVSGQRSALVTVPLHHMYGFTFGLLLPLALGAPIRSVPLLPAVVASAMQEGDLVVGIPLLWSRFMESDAFKHVTAPKESLCLLTATAPTPAHVLEHFQGQGFLMREFYGASEMGAVGCRPQAGKPFSLLGHWQRGEDGISTESLVRTLPCGQQGEYALLDHITWHSERTFTHSRRLDKAVQVGGVNVYPDHVQKLFLEQVGVKDCYVRIMRPEEGARLKAFIVPEQGQDIQALRKVLTSFSRKNLSEAQRPGAYTFGEDIPRGPLGKPSDW